MSAPWAASFTGSSSYLSITNFTGNPSAFSFSSWVNLGTSQNTTIWFSNFNSGSGQGFALGTRVTPNNQLRFYLGSSTLESGNTLTPGTWYYVTFTHDGTTANIYMDGNPTPVATTNTAVSYGSVPATNVMGALIVPSTQAFNGSLAQPGFWNKALSTTEIASLYNSGFGLMFAQLSGSLLTSLMNYLDFANSGNLGLDSSAAANNWTNTGVTQVVGPAVGNPAMVPVSPFPGLPNPILAQ